MYQQVPFRNDEEFLQPRKPQQTSRMPQFSNYAKENFAQKHVMNTVKKKPQIFETHQNVSPIRHVAFKVSQPISPRIPIQQSHVTPQRVTYNQNFTYTPQKVVQPYIMKTLTPSRIEQPQINYFDQQRQTLPSLDRIQIQQLQQQQYSQQQQQQQQLKQQQQQSYQYNQQPQSTIQQSSQKQDILESRVNDNIALTMSSNQNNSIYTCLQEELLKSELKLQQLNQRSKDVQEQRKKLQEQFKNQSLKETRRY